VVVLEDLVAEFPYPLPDWLEELEVLLDPDLVPEFP
jgi:hypothetical protein